MNKGFQKGQVESYLSEMESYLCRKAFKRKIT